MNRKPDRSLDGRLAGFSVVLLALSSGCFWQQSKYTDQMRAGFDTYEARLKVNNALSPGVRADGEFLMWIRPPQPMSAVKVPDDRKDLVAWFQGGVPVVDVELIVMGSSGSENMGEFQRTSLNNLNSNPSHRGPAQDAVKSEPPFDVRCMHDGKNIIIERFTGETQRQSADGQAVRNFWIIHFAEDGPQKVMLAYVVPLSKLSEFTERVNLSLASLALGGKVAIAESGRK